jgi:hypothetical protein
MDLKTGLNIMILAVMFVPNNETKSRSRGGFGLEVPLRFEIEQEIAETSCAARFLLNLIGHLRQIRCNYLEAGMRNLILNTTEQRWRGAAFTGFSMGAI